MLRDTSAWDQFRRATWDLADGRCWICEQPVAFDAMQLDGGWDGNRLYPKHLDCRRRTSVQRVANGNGRLRLFEVARLYGLSSETLKEWAAARILPLYRNGNYGHFWVNVADVDKITKGLLESTASRFEASSGAASLADQD